MGPYRFGFVMEQTLGHATYHRRLAQLVAEDPTVCATWLAVAPWEDDRWARMPVVGRNFSLSLSLRARDRLRCDPDVSAYDALFFHTQSTAMFSLGLARRYPVVVSLDATPLNMDTVGPGYGHRPDRPGPVGRLKRRWYRSVFGGAAALTTWNHWARESLVRDYGVQPGRVEVIPPGVDLAEWCPGPRAGEGRAVPRVLFVGRDFARKGGEVLLEAYRAAPADRYELDIVTEGDVPAMGPGVRVHRGLSHDRPALRRLFLEADLFVLPTLAECMPLVIIEAMACGLPVVATRLAAIPEQVVHDGTGLLVPPRHPGALARAVGALVTDPARRRALGSAGRARAETLFDGRRNTRALLDLLKGCADRGARRHTPERGWPGPDLPPSEQTNCHARQGHPTR
jgi:glycosyltransferase involved in cell wall biosynthesis